MKQQYMQAWLKKLRQTPEANHLSGRLTSQLPTTGTCYCAMGLLMEVAIDFGDIDFVRTPDGYAGPELELFNTFVPSELYEVSESTSLFFNDIVRLNDRLLFTFNRIADTVEKEENANTP